MKIKLFNDCSIIDEQIKKKTFKQIDETNRDISTFLFKDIILTGISLYYPDILFYQFNSDIHHKYERALILPIKEMSMSLNKKSYYEENGMTFNECDKNNINLMVRITNDVFFFIYNTENYYHFIYDTLPYLYSYFELKKTNPKLKLLMNYNKNKIKLLPFVQESLQILGIKENDIIIHEHGNIYSNVYVSTSLTHNGMSNEPPRKEIFEIYNMMIKNVLNNTIINRNDIQNMKNIYISRRTWINNNEKGQSNIGTNYTMRRKLMNEDELVEKLSIINNKNDEKNKCFTEFFGENYSMSEKIVIFNNAEIIVGAIGGTIANCVFCNKDKCKVIALVSPDFMRLNNRMKYLFDNKNKKNNIIMFEDCYLDCKENEIAQNVRIEVTNRDSIYYRRIGEIIRCISFENQSYLIRLANNMIGLSANDTFDEIIITKNDFKTLDNGINSPWKINVDKLSDVITCKF